MALCAVGDVLKYFIPCGTRRRDIPRQQELCDRPYTGRYGTGRSDESDGPVRGLSLIHISFAEPGTSIGTEGIGDTGNAGGTGDTGSTDTTWYLADIRTTGDSGTITWEGLSESAYRLKEVRAPEGYQITDTGYLEAVKPDRQEGNTDPLVLTITVKNTSAFVLPKTGGTGTLPVNLAGILCLCYSGFLYKKKRAGVFTQKEKGGKGK